MLKKSLPAVFVLFSCMMATPLFAQYSGIDEETFVRQGMQEVASNPELKELMENTLSLLDVNSDNFISENEFSYFVSGFDASQKISEQKKEKYRQQALDFFRQADKNRDNRLDMPETKNFYRMWQEFLLREEFAEKDLNNDKILDNNDIPSVEESMAQLQKSVEKLKTATEQLNEIDPQEAASQMIENMKKMQAEEDFFQMDKDKDGCVSREDYAAYNLLSDKMAEEQREELSFKLSEQDYAEMYDAIEKKNPECLTKEEYIADYMVPMAFEDFDDLPK